MNDPQTQKLIDGRQLFLLLFLGRMFSMMTYAPGKEAQPGSVALAAQLPALALELAVLLLAFWAARRCGRGGLLQAAFARSRLLGLLCTGVCLVFYIMQAAQTLTVQTDFLAQTIYQLPSRLGLLLALWGGIVYAAHLGLESFARMSVWVCLAFVVLTLLLALQAAPGINWLNLHDPREQGLTGLAQSAALNLSHSAELGAAVLLVPAVRDNSRRWAVSACLAWRGVCLLFAFLVLGVLGSFAATRSYPLYTLALAGSEGSALGRLDAPLFVVWIFLAVIRGSLFLWLAADCVRHLFGTKQSPSLTIASGAVLAAVLCAGQLPDLWQSPFLWGGLLLTVSVAVPLTVLIFAKAGVRHDAQSG